MKKKVIIASIICLVLLVIILVISGVFSKKKSLQEEYLTVFKNRSFIIDGKKKKMKDLLGEDDEVDYYSFVDYENDSHIEMFVSIFGKSVNNYIFRLKGNKMYAYFVEESITSNTEDGYSAIGDADESGWVKYSFKNNKLIKENVIYINYDENVCEYNNEKTDCGTIVDKEIELLNKIGRVADNIKYEE
jgi:hypothetical protein